MRRILFNRNPDIYEAQVLSEYVDEMRKKKVPMDKLYFFIDLDSNQGIEITTYPTASVEFLSEELECSHLEALYCFANHPGFLKDLKEILYWNDLNGINKYNVTTMHFNKHEEQILNETVVYSKSIEEAEQELVSQGFVVTEIINVDE